MPLDDDFARMQWAFTWENIRFGDLNEALHYGLQAVEEGDDAPGDQYITALGIVGGVYAELGDFEKALEFSESCFQKFSEKYNDQPDDEDKLLAMSAAYFTLGLVYSRMFKVKDAFSAFYDLYQAASGYHSAHPASFPIVKIKTISCECICDLLIKQEVPSMTWPFLVEYNKVVRQVLAETPKDIYANYKLALSDIYFGDFYFQTGQNQEAIEHYLKAEEQAAKLTREYKERFAYIHTLYGVANERLGIIYTQMEKCGEGLFHHTRNRCILEKTLVAFPDSFVFQTNLAICEQWLAIVHYKQGKMEDSLSHLDQSFGLAVKLMALKPDFAELHRLQSVTFQYKGFIYTALGKLKEAYDGYINMYNVLKHLIRLCPDSLLYKENTAHACCRFWFFLFNEMNDLKAKDYLVEGCNLYSELVAEYPDIVELKQKLEMATGFLAAS